MAYNDIDSGKVLNKEGLLELSGQIKGYIEDNIPQAYTLPTASTTALGGVKVDGETITISNGVISAVNSGGSGDDYKEVETISIENLQLNSDNSNILTQEQQAWFVNLYQKFSSHQVMPDIWINGNHILFYNTTPATTSNTVYFNLYGLSRPFTTNNYQLIEGLRYYNFMVIINGDGTALSDSRLEWYERTQKADSIPLRSVMNIAGHTTGNVNDAISTLASAYATKDYVDVKVPDVSTTATDGVYKLTSTVASGTATFSWEEDSGSSGGATYTAGSGISIDENNVISNTIQDTGTGVILGMILSTLGNNDGNYVFAFSDSITDGDQAIGCLLSHKVINTTYSTRGVTLTTANKNTYRNKIGASQDETITQFVISNNGTITIYPLSNAFIPASSFTFAICSGRVIISIYYNRTTHRFANLPSLGGFPTAPTTDGDYVLKVSVSSGTPTYSWVAATTGGSY